MPRESKLSLNILREFFLGFIKIHILYHAGEEKQGFSGVDLARELKRHGYSISPGTLYPVLHRLQKGGYLIAEKSIIDGRMKIYYRLTRRGEIALEKIKPKIKELVDEVLAES